MKTLPITAAKARLSELVDNAQMTSEEYAITVNGSPAAVLVGNDEWEALNESLYWLSQPGILQEVEQARADIAAGKGLTEADVRARLQMARA